MRRLLLAASTLVAAVVLPMLPSHADGMFGATGASGRAGLGTAFQQAFGDCGDPCVVRDNVGGKLNTYFLAAAQIRAEHRHLMIDGRCYSACASAADWVRANVCITPAAQFGFHLRHETMMVEDEPITFNIGKGRDAEQPLSNDLRAWVLRHGGFPASATRFMLMSAGEAAKFFKRCGQ